MAAHFLIRADPEPLREYSNTKGLDSEAALGSPVARGKQCRCQMKSAKTAENANKYPLHPYFMSQDGEAL